MLLVSALLTAGYLLPVAMRGFFPGTGVEEAGGLPGTGVEEAGASLEAGVEENGALPEAGGAREPAPAMLAPLGVLAAVAVLLGIFPGPLTEYVSGIAASVLYR